MIPKNVLCLFCFNYILVGFQATTTPRTLFHSEGISSTADNDFRNALQQQTFASILKSIEDRLKNLDSIYSMQLATSLDVKLDQYSRKLESLDTKIIRLEALVMLNLDKISENISTKNFKDDIGRTSTYRKMDTMYEGISHRLSYMDRKYDGSFMKMQEKIDTALMRLERIEDATTRRETDTEASFSEIMFTIDDFRSNYSETARKIEKASDDILNNTKDTINLISRYHTEERKSLNKFHDNIIANLEYIDNKTSEHYKVSDDTNGILKTMRSELKQDFNSYANKVADMNSDMWKTTDVTDGDLKQVAVVVNQTKTEIQNGVRSIMVQLGKMSVKGDTAATDYEPYQKINKKLDDNFEKILTNQGIFLESCHRLQMDEAQIETEISRVLEKLIDMIEMKLVKESRNMKNFETFLKGHDTRVKRNVVQANNNILSLFQKSTLSNQAMTEEIRKIRWDLEAIFSLLRSMPHNNHNQRELEKIIKQLDIMDDKTMTSMRNITTQLKNVFEIVSATKHLTLLNNHTLATISSHQKKTMNADSNLSPSTKSNQIPIDRDTRKLIDQIFGNGKSINPKQKNNTRVWRMDNEDDNINKAIDDASGTSNESQEVVTTLGRTNDNLNNTKVFGTPEQTTETTTIKVNRDIQKAIEEIFGPAPTLDKTSVTPNPTKCRQNYQHLIDIRGNFGTSDCEETSMNSNENRVNQNRNKRRRKKKKQKNIKHLIDIRGNFDTENENATEAEYEDDYSEAIDDNISTEITTETADGTTTHQ